MSFDLIKSSVPEISSLDDSAFRRAATILQSGSHQCTLKVVCRSCERRKEAGGSSGTKVCIDRPADAVVDKNMVVATVRRPRGRAREASRAKTTVLPALDFPSIVREVREQQSLSPERLAELVNCPIDDVHAIEIGEGQAAVLYRVLDTLKINLTGLKPAPQMFRRLQLTRDAKRWTVDKLAQRTGLSRLAITDLEDGRGSVTDLLIVLSALSRTIRVRSDHGSNGTSDKDSRFTPPYVAKAIEYAFGKITTDPCSHPLSPVQAVNQISKAEGGDGLDGAWSGEVVFVNPPYSRSSDWLRKVNSEWQRAQIGILICLVNAKTDAAAFHEALRLGASVCFLEGRVKYLKPDGTSEPSSQPSMLLVFGATEEQRQAFTASVRGTWMKLLSLSANELPPCKKC